MPTSTLLVTGAALQVAPNILSIAHWDRLLGGKLYAPLSRVDWDTLLRRTFDVDVTQCTGCAGRMTVRAVVTDHASIDRGISTTSCSDPRPRAALLRALLHYVGLRSQERSPAASIPRRLSSTKEG